MRARGVRVDAAVLRREMARRGLSVRRLAREAKLSPSTILAAMDGHAIAVASYELIDEALGRHPPLAFADELLLDLREDDSTETHIGD